MAKQTFKPITGTRDFSPASIIKRKYVIDIVEEIYQSFGFVPIETPVMERIDTLLDKYGDEGSQLIFRVLKRGDKLKNALSNDPNVDTISDIGLRYDLTVPLARYIASNRNDLPKFFKRYQIQTVYRADRPGKGRFREFFQCDVDIIGSKSLVVETEVLNAGASVFERLGFSKSQDFTIRINHRGILKGMLESVKVPQDLESETLVAIDKLDKIGIDGVREELISKGLSQSVMSGLISVFNSTPQDIETAIPWLQTLLKNSVVGLKGIQELESLIRYSKGGAAYRHLTIDPYLVRGLSYYTGTIYELEIEGFKGSCASGGRYDNLIGMFCNQQFPACGFSLGLERVIIAMEERNLFPEALNINAHVLITYYNEEMIEASLALANSLRKSKLRVDVYPQKDSYGKQLKYCEDQKIGFAVFISPHEVDLNVVGIKDMQTGIQDNIEKENVVQWLESRILL
jgi:histidyl-tRNA synthetase